MSELDNKPLNYGNLERFYKDLLKNDLKELEEKIKENKGARYTAGTGIDIINNVISNTQTQFSGDYNDLINKPDIITSSDLTNLSQSPIPLINLESDNSNSFAIDPNKMYMFGTRTTLTITLNAGTSGIVNEYMFLFTSDSTATTLNVPNTVVWLKDPDILTDKKYAVSIENNLAIIGEWSNE